MYFLSISLFSLLVLPCIALPQTPDITPLTCSDHRISCVSTPFAFSP